MYYLKGRHRRLPDAEATHAVGLGTLFMPLRRHVAPMSSPAPARPGFKSQRDTPDDVEPAVFNGAVLPRVDIPGEVAAGDTIDVSGTVGFDCPTCFVDRDIRVVVEASTGESRTDNVGKLSGRGETATFSVSIPAPQKPDQSVEIRVKAQRNPPDPFGDWTTDNTETASVNIVTEGELLLEQLADVAPWVIGGAAVGGGVGLAEPTPIRTPAGAIVGGGVGLGAHVATNEAVVPEFTFPTVPVLAVAGLLGAGGLLLAQLPDPS